MTDEEKDIYIDTMANNLKMLRTRLNLTQAELANIIGISRYTLAPIENKQRTMTWNTFLSLLLVFIKNKDTNELLNSIGIYTDELNDFLKRR